MATLQHVHVRHDFASSPPKVFAALSEHENLGGLFGAKVTRVRDGERDRNGVGSVRSLMVKGMPPAFEETVTVFEPDRLIEYKITKGSPLTDHHGIQRFEPVADGGTHLDYQIWFGSKVPGLAAVVKKSLESSIAKYLPTIVD